MSQKENPFHVLGIPVNSSDEEIARQYNKLCRSRPEEQPAFRRAWEQLRSNSRVRQVHEITEMPDTDYSVREKEWRSFERANRKNPVDFADLAAQSPAGPPAEAVPELVTAALNSALRTTNADIALLAAHAATLPGGTAPPIGIEDVIFG